MRVLVLGGYGFIGEAVCRALDAAGRDVAGLGRDTTRAARRMPFVRWIKADLRELQTAEAWSRLLIGVDAIVNAAGALQDGGGDNLDATQHRAMLALYQAAAASPPMIVQISANTAGAGAQTAFMATKRMADAALAKSGLPFVILRPALVIGRNAHGGTALVRALAAFPFGAPLIHGSAEVATVALDDVATAVVSALDGRIPPRTDMALAHPRRTTLAELVAAHRAWLGLPAAPSRHAPGWLARLAGAAADAAGRLGWRPPLRSTALAVMAGGIEAAESKHEPPDSLRPVSGVIPLKSLAETLASNPAGVQDLWFARLYLLKPALIVGLALFWIFSGSIALFRFDQSAAYLAATGLDEGLSGAMTWATSLADIGLGLAVMWRSFAARALIAMVGLSLAYLAAATILSPGLWLDPLGPLLKVVPSILLALTARAILDER
ncbi:MAG: SDR family oxidoreductase [Phyllobacteriaceae bacterium]|nr:SDR family oxidoreductase [Phyllobacteriaceae bacterium]